MSKINKFYFPLFINFSILLNSILSGLGLKSLYLLFTIVAIVFLLIDYKKKIVINNFLFIPIIYLLLLTLILYIQIFTYYSYIDTLIKGYILYSLFFFYWILYFMKYSIIDFKKILITTIPIAYIIAILGIIQFFVSPDLFGLLQHNSNAIKWASNDTLSQYILYFRASSILGSPQIYGLFIIFYIIITDNLNFFKNNFINKVGFIILLLSGFLSGNKSFVLLLILFFLYKSRKNKKFLFLLISIFFLIVIINKYYITIGSITRIINFQKIEQQEQNDSRIQRYKNAIVNSNIYIGDGIGINTFIKNKKQKAIESYFFQILSESGIIIFLYILLIMYLSYFFSYSYLFENIKVFIIFVCISMVIVHAFFSPIFFIIWGIIISSFKRKIFEFVN